MQNHSINNFFQSVDKLTRVYLKNSELPGVIVMGTYNSGKSTLINHLLGKGLSPVDIIPTTPAPVRFTYGEKFRATVHYQDMVKQVITEKELHGLLTRCYPEGKAGKQVSDVRVRYKHDLLKKMYLVDTPGVDALQETYSVQNILPESECIVYLLQQRGLSEGEQKQIQKLAARYTAGKISFWINCNLGAWDDTSLEESARYLRQICNSEVSVHLINTMCGEDVNRFQLFIEYQTARLKLQKISEKLNRMDDNIDNLLGLSTKEEDDADFLIRLWPAVEQARLVMQRERMIKSLPLVLQQINTLLGENAARDLNQNNFYPPSTTEDCRWNPGAARDSIKALIERVLVEPALKPYAATKEQLELLHAKIKNENYLITAAGGFSSGKSTFFNALMGEAILPAQNRSTTFAITLIRHGDKKKATVNYADQVTIPSYYTEGEQAVICRHELAALERWVTDQELAEQIFSIEKCKHNRSIKITVQELLRQIETIKESFAKVKRRTPKRKRSWKSIFARIALQKLTVNDLADCFKVYFKNSTPLEIPLDTPQGVSILAEVAASHLALRVSEITVEHPAELLRLATFVDTPGLDSVYRHHQEITKRYLPNSDCFLFFLNGKHILTQPDMGIWEILQSNLTLKQQASRKLYLLVNFTDTMTHSEQVKVRQYLYEYLVKPSKGGIAPENIYFISALEALTGRDKNNLSNLTEHLKENIWISRCAENYREFIKTFRKILVATVQDAAGPKAQGINYPAGKGIINQQAAESTSSEMRLSTAALAAAYRYTHEINQLEANILGAISLPKH